MNEPGCSSIIQGGGNGVRSFPCRPSFLDCAIHILNHSASGFVPAVDAGSRRGSVIMVPDDWRAVLAGQQDENATLGWWLIAPSPTPKPNQNIQPDKTPSRRRKKRCDYWVALIAGQKCQQRNTQGSQNTERQTPFVCNVLRKPTQCSLSNDGE